MTGRNLLAFGLFLAICAAGNLTGFAAGAPIDPSQLGRGTQAVSCCPPTPVVEAFDTGYDAQIGDYAVTAVRLSGLDTRGSASCAGHRFLVVLIDSQGNALSERDGAVPQSGTTFSVDVTDAHVSVAALTTVHVTITG